MANTPNTMYVGMNRMIKKIPHKGKKKEEAPEETSMEQPIVNPKDDFYIGEENGEALYINKKALKDSISRS